VRGRNEGGDVASSRFKACSGIADAGEEVGARTAIRQNRGNEPIPGSPKWVRSGAAADRRESENDVNFRVFACQIEGGDGRRSCVSRLRIEGTNPFRASRARDNSHLPSAARPTPAGSGPSSGSPWVAEAGEGKSKGATRLISPRRAIRQNRPHSTRTVLRPALWSRRRLPTMIR